MAERVSKSKFKPRALEYLRQVGKTGEPLVSTDRGRAVAKIERYREGEETRRFLRGCVTRFDEPTEPLADGTWEAGDNVPRHLRLVVVDPFA